MIITTIMKNVLHTKKVIYTEATSLTFGVSNLFKNLLNLNNPEV